MGQGSADAGDSLAMKIRGWPRSIRSQLLGGLVLLEALSMILFATVLVNQQANEIYTRANQRLQHQATSLASQVTEALKGDRQGDVIHAAVRIMGDAPSVDIARVTDTQGKVLDRKSVV